MSYFDQLGGDEGVRALVERFYDAMDSRADCAPIRAMHPEDLGESRLKLYEFLSGWLGGSPLYHQRRGHPRLRARHMPFPIDERARDQWMACMHDALADAPLGDAERLELYTALLRVADFMRNRAG